MMQSIPKISIAIPIHDMKNGDVFLSRLINSLVIQTFRDFEVVITKAGSMPVNTNSAIKQSKGELIKILYMDDYLAHPSSLQHMVEAMDYYDGSQWLITATDTNTDPHWTDDIQIGNNKLGSPSALIIRNKNPLLFDENMSWLLDCDYYRRMYDKYGEPIILEDINVRMGIGDHQMTGILTNEEKLLEHEYMNKKYE